MPLMMRLAAVDWLSTSSQPDDGAQSLFNLRGAIEREDAFTQCEDEEMTSGRQTPHTDKDWSKELPLSTEILVQGKLSQRLVKEQSVTRSRLQRYMGPRAN